MRTTHRRGHSSVLLHCLSLRLPTPRSLHIYAPPVVFELIHTRPTLGVHSLSICSIFPHRLSQPAVSHILRDCIVISESRKSRLVSLAEGLMKPIDEHVRERVNAIFVEKERYAYQLKEKAAARTHECKCVSYVHISNQSIPSRH